MASTQTEGGNSWDIFPISYLAGERFYLRTLLLHTKGATSFKVLKTVHGITHIAYRNACVALGLLIDDFLYDSTIRKASIQMSTFALSQMFAMICVHTPPANPQGLFSQHYKVLTDDLIWIDMARRDLRQLTKKEQKVIGLFRLETIIHNLGSSMEDCGLTIRVLQRLAMACIIA